MTIDSVHSSFVIRHSSFSLRLRSWYPYLTIAALYLACALLVDPRGEFPLNDDWSYSRSAFRFGIEGRMQIDEWSAPNLLGQALYGGLLTKAFGPSFLPLRLSTLLLSCFTACLMWAVLQQLKVRPCLSWVATLAWIFNPVWFCLSFTYMTEVPFLCFVMLSLFIYVIYLRSRRPWLLLLCGAVLGYAFLIRQTSLLFIASMLAAVIVAGARGKIGPAIRRALLLAGTAGLFILGFSLWSGHYGGATPAAQRKFELLTRITSTQIIGNSFGLLFYLAFFCLPLSIGLIARLFCLSREVGRRVWVWAAGWSLISASGLWWFHAHCGDAPYLPARPFHSRMPFLLNVLYDTGLGPLTLDPTYYGQTPTPMYPNVWWTVTFLAAAGAVFVGLLLSLTVFRIRRSTMNAGRRELLLFLTLSSLIVIAFEVAFSHMQEGGLFDRHILTAALPFFFLIALSGERPVDSPETESQIEPGTPAPNGLSGLGQRLRFGSRIVGLHWLVPVATGLALAVLAWFSVASTHDYLSWNRLRWELGNELLAVKTDPLTISGGFEFNAWHNYDAFRARGNIGKVYYWWYDRLDYLITMEQQEAYHVSKKKEYFSWLHRRNLPVYLLEKDKQN